MCDVHIVHLEDMSSLDLTPVQPLMFQGCSFENDCEELYFMEDMLQFKQPKLRNYVQQGELPPELQTSCTLEVWTPDRIALSTKFPKIKRL